MPYFFGRYGEKYDYILHAAMNFLLDNEHNELNRRMHNILISMKNWVISRCYVDFNIWPLTPVTGVQVPLGSPTIKTRA